MKDVELHPENIELIRGRLQEKGLTLDESLKSYSRDEVKELWAVLRNEMAKAEPNLYQYWAFIYKMNSKAEQVINHDVTCLQNVYEKSQAAGQDELGPKVYFVTVHRALLRLRRKYPFIISAEQLVEYMLPYMFLGDIPVENAERFPNQLLSAQLGTLIVQKPPEMNDLIRSFLADPSLLKKDPRKLGPQMADAARLLNASRLNEIIDRSQVLDEDKKNIVATEMAKLMDEISTIERRQYFKTRDESMAALEAIIKQRDAKIDKLQRTVHFWRYQANK
jgi:hypothetical protein